MGDGLTEGVASDSNREEGAMLPADVLNQLSGMRKPFRCGFPFAFRRRQGVAAKD
jgi:hypothetical protein